MLCKDLFYLQKRELEDDICRAKYDAWYQLAAKPIKTLEIPHPMLSF